MVTIQIPLKQHVGAPCKAIVSVGQQVKRGQLIATPTGLGANIHASVNGEVTNVNMTGIVISLSKEQTHQFLPIKQADNPLDMIEEAGIVGAGGAGFPTHVKLASTIKGGYLIANAAECEPLLAHNSRSIEEDTDRLIEGLKIMQAITEAAEVYIAIKPKYTKAVKKLEQAVKNEPNIHVKFLSDMYPAGDERVVVRELVGVTLEPGQLPIVANTIVSNIETVKHVAEAVILRKPFIDKDLTVSGRVVNGTQVYRDIPIGTPAATLIEATGGYIEPHGEIVLGGPFTGSSGTEMSPVMKTTGGFIVAMPYPQEKRNIGILICECGGSEERLTEIATNMGAKVVAAERCKRMVEVNGRYRCDLPGICPGQAEKVLTMKKAGAEVILTGTCQD